MLNKISIDIKAGEFVSFIGPSGSGKTALLRIVAGLEQQDSGKIILKGEDISHWHPFERNVNTIFNSFSLFSELSVYDNIEFGLNFKKIKQQEKTQIVNHAIEIFELEPYLAFPITGLDKIVKYKIALARALVNNPDVLLLDDSLKLLDNKDRLKMRYELKLLQRKLNKTFIYITEDINTAFALGDRVGILQNGVLHQFDLPQIIYEQPNTFFVASFVGNMNFFSAQIKSNEDGIYSVELDDKLLIRTTNMKEFTDGRELFYVIRTEWMYVVRELEQTESNINYIEGTIINKDYSAEYTQYYIKLNYDKIIVVSMLNYEHYAFDKEAISYFTIGEKVFIKWSILAGNLVYA